MTWMIPCGKCPQCLRGKGNICSGNFPAFLEGMLLDGTSRIKDKDGNMVRHDAAMEQYRTDLFATEADERERYRNFLLQQLPHENPGVEVEVEA